MARDVRIDDLELRVAGLDPSEAGRLGRAVALRLGEALAGAHLEGVPRAVSIRMDLGPGNVSTDELARRIGRRIADSLGAGRGRHG